MRTNAIGKVCEVAPGKTPAKAAYTSVGDIKIVKFRDVLDSGTVDFGNNEEGWFDTRYADDGDLVDLLPGTILLTNAAHSVEHIGKKVAFVESVPNIAKRVCFVGELTGIRSNDESFHATEWVYYWLQTNEAKAAIVKSVEGAHLVPRQFKRIVLPCFSPDEQSQHLGLLKLADEAIAKARAELVAARALKRSLLNTLFVKGMPGRHRNFTETKLGRLPATWRILRVKDVLVGKTTNGYSPQSNPEPPGTKTLNVACIRNGECDVDKATYVDIDDSIVQSLQVRCGNFFVLRGNGNRNFIGIGGIVRNEIDGPFIYSDLLFRLQFNESDAIPFFIPHLWQTQAFLHRLQAKAKSGSGLWKISKRDIENELLALPELTEQREIVVLIESAIAAFNFAKEKVEALQEVKRSLLQNLLTGQIRIPEGAIHA